MHGVNVKNGSPLVEYYLPSDFASLERLVFISSLIYLSDSSLSNCYIQ